MGLEPLSLVSDMIEAGIRARGSAWTPEFYQRSPTGKWDTWALIGGRGIGKSDAGSFDFVEHVRGPACLSGSTPHRMAIIAPTLGDAVESCWKAPAGISVHDPTARIVTTKGGTIIKWTNGSEAKLFGAYTPDDIERLRAGGNRCRLWAEELAAWRHLEEAWNMAMLGLRLGPHPRSIITSTPKPRKPFKTIIGGPGTVRAMTEDGRVPTTDDNPHLPESRRKELYRLFGGTRFGRQELKGEILEDTPGAFWTGDIIERARLVVGSVTKFDRVVIAIDPATTSDEDSDETGIIGGAKRRMHSRAACCTHPEHAESHPLTKAGEPEPHDHYFVLADRSLRASPSGWAGAAISLYEELEADRIVAEVNNGGDMVVSTIANVDRNVPVKKIHASRGKTVRAEPASTLYERCLVHHIGQFPELEDQQTTFTGPDSIEHDDRLDALAYVLHELSTGGVAFMASVVQHGADNGHTARRTGRRADGYRNPRGD